MELVLATPIFVVALLLAVTGGRLVSTRSDVDAAARDAARAASIARSPAAAARDGQTAAEASLAQRGLSCADLKISIDTARFRPGGSVVASVACAVDLSDLSGLGLPGARTVSARFAEPVDNFRGIDS